MQVKNLFFILIFIYATSVRSENLPTSLFGIDLGKSAENYLTDRKEFDEDNKKAEEGDGYRYICNTNEHLDTAGGEPWKRDEKI